MKIKSEIWEWKNQNTICSVSERDTRAERPCHCDWWAIVVGLFLLGVSTARAATFVVTNTADTGPGSLREAINSANSAAGADVILFQDVVFGGTRKTIVTDGFLPVISTDVTIIGPEPGVMLTTANGSSTTYGFSVTGGNVQISFLTLQGFRRGVRAVGGTTILRSCTIFATNGIGSGVNMDGATTSVTLENCTVAGLFYGIFNTTGILTVHSCTITENNTGILCDPNSVNTFNLSNSLIVGNTANVEGALDLDRFNIKTGTASQAGLDPAGLQENGGPTPTIALVTDSPALDKGETSLTLDQRGVPRPFDLPTVANGTAGASDIGAFESQGNQSLIVTILADENNGTSDPSLGAGTSLREAIAFANQRGTNSTITFATNVTGTITLTRALPSLARNISIQGPGANLLTVSGNNAVRVFYISNGGLSGPTISISGITIARGRTSGNDFGAGIRNHNGSLFLDGVVVSSNNATMGDFGGGISNLGLGGAASLSISNSAINSNSANTSGSPSTGGAIFNSASDVNGLDGVANLTMVNCTVSGNVSAELGAIANAALADAAATVVLSFCTFSGNTAANSTAGAIIANLNNGGTATVTLNHTILNVANGMSLFNQNGTIISQNYNLSSDGTGNIGNGGNFLNQPNDQINTNPLLGPLQNNGGPTPTHALSPVSPAIDVGNPASTQTRDQRGETRPFDGDLIAGARPDLGAFESHATPPPPLNFVVTSLADNGTGTLRAAITSALTNGGLNSVSFAPGLAGTITLSSALPDLNRSIFIQGPGANVITVSGNDQVRVFHIANGRAVGPTVLISGITIARGRIDGSQAPASSGGGILNEYGTLTLDAVVLRDNFARGGGGGLYSLSGTGNASVTISNSTISGNSSIAQYVVDGNGGGLFNNGIGGTATMIVRNCTLSGNNGGTSGASFGGGIYNMEISGVATLEVVNCTFSGNVAGAGGGIFNRGALTIGNTILQHGSAGENLANFLGGITSQGHNLSDDNGGGYLTGAGDQINTDPKIGALQNNGGPTFTHALLAGSPAINTGGSTSLTRDQRGLSRVSGSAADKGAYELQPESYAFWASYIFPPGTSGTLTNFTGDPDGDGFSNGLEQSIGHNPLLADATNRLVTVKVQGTNLVLQYERSITADPVRFFVEQSIDLQTWTTPGITYQNLSPVSATTELIQALIPMNGAPKKFGRLRSTP